MVCLNAKESKLVGPSLYNRLLGEVHLAAQCTLDRIDERELEREMASLLKIRAALVSIVHPEQLKSETDKINHTLATLELDYSHDTLLEKIKKIIALKDNVNFINNLFFIINPLIVSADAKIEILKKIINISYEFHPTHGSTVHFLFWKHSTPTNDFYDVMKDLDLKNQTQVTQAIHKLDMLYDALAAKKLPLNSEATPNLKMRS